MLDNTPKGFTDWVFDDQELVRMLRHVKTASHVVLDLETTGLDEHALTLGEANGGVGARVAMAMMTMPQGVDGRWNGEEPPTAIIPLSHPRSPFRGRWQKALRLIARTIKKYDVRLVGHHVKFDVRWIYATTGVDLSSQIHWDTQMSSHLIDETQPTALEYRAEKELGVEPWGGDLDLSYPGAAEEEDIWKLGAYGAKDTYWTHKLYELHKNILFIDDDSEPENPEEASNKQLGKVAELVSMPTARSLAKIEQHGFTLDLSQLSEEEYIRLFTAKETLTEICETYDMSEEGASTHATSKWFKELTEKAVDKGDLRIAQLTKTGNPQWDKHVLGKQARGGSRLAELILKRRAASKDLEFFKSWREKTTKYGTIHSTYRAGHVATGRLSSSSPNFQQINKTLRPMFIPRPGYVIADIDYSQLELRVAAFISRSKPMMEAYRQGLDLHSLMAADLATRQRWKDDPDAPPVAVEDVSDVDRQKAKACIAEGELVTTDRGEVSIEEVKLTDKVWDGQEWVSHAGLIHRGYREVITYAGLTATADHKVMTSSGNMYCLGYAKRHEFNLAVTWGPDQPFVSPNVGHYIHWEPDENGLHTRMRDVCGRGNTSPQVFTAFTGSENIEAQRYCSYHGYSGCPRSYEYESEEEARNDPRQWAMTYDLAEAGPRHCFTVSNRLVSQCNFGYLFGQKPLGFQSYADKVWNLDISEEESQEIYDGFFETWDGMREWHERTLQFARQHGFVESPIGRRRFLPDINDRNPFYREADERRAYNAPVQGFGSDLMQMGIASIYGEMPGTERVPDVYPVATVHDSLVVEIPEDNWRDPVEECIHRITHLEPFLEQLGVEMDVPLVADATVGTRWSLDDVGTI